MAIPLIPIAVATAVAASLGYTGKKGYDAYKDTKDAKLWHETAKVQYEASEHNLLKRKDEAQKVFAELGEIKKSVIEGTFPRYFKLIDELKLEAQKDLGEVLKDFDMTKLKETRQSIIDLQTTLGGIAAGGVAGAMAGFGAYGAVGLLATASTGTAIGTLSGAAAVNATLAWLGGGSLAAGGLGVAGGTAALGGIVAAPVIAVAALVWAKSAESKKYDAMSYYNAVNAICESLKAEELLWVQIANNTKRQKNDLVTINTEFAEAMYLVESIIKNKNANVSKLGKLVNSITNSSNTDISKWDKDEQESVKNMIQLAETTQTIINAPILFDDDPITKDIIKHQKKTKELMDELQAKFS